MKTRMIVLVASFGVAALPAAAQVRWYAAASAGQARTGIEYVRSVEGGIANQETQETSFDDNDAAWKLSGGMRFNRNVALEVSYVDLGKISTSTRGLGGNFTQPFGLDVTRKVRGVGLDVVGTLPLSARLGLLGRAGLYRMNVKADLSLVDDITFTTAPNDRSRAIESREDIPHVGLGLQFHAAPRWTVRAEYEKFMGVGNRFVVGDPNGTGRADVNVASVGIVFDF